MTLYADVRPSLEHSVHATRYTSSASIKTQPQFRDRLGVLPRYYPALMFVYLWCGHAKVLHGLYALV